MIMVMVQSIFISSTFYILFYSGLSLVCDIFIFKWMSTLIKTETPLIASEFI